MAKTSSDPAEKTTLRHANERIPKLLLVPPRWLIVAGSVFLLVLPWQIHEKRGWGWALLAIATYGTLACINLFVPPERLREWTAKHRSADSSFFAPLLVLTLAFFTTWPAWVCFSIGLIAGVTFVALVTVLRG